MSRSDNIDYGLNFCFGIFVLINGIIYMFSVRMSYESYEFSKDWDIPEEVKNQNLYNAYSYLFIGFLCICLGILYILYVLLRIRKKKLKRSEENETSTYNS